MDDELQSHKELVLLFCARIAERETFTEHEAQDAYRAARAVEATLDVIDEPDIRQHWVYLIGRIKSALDTKR